MKNIRYYVSRKNALTWISAAMAVSSAVLLLLGYFLGERETISTANFWFQKILPMAATLSFALRVLIGGGKELYRTTRPLFWACFYFGQIALDQYHRPDGIALFGYRRWVAVCWILYFVLYLCYRFLLTGRYRRPLVLSAVFFVPVLVLGYDLVDALGTIPTWYLLDKIANTLMAASVFALTFAMREFHDGRYHPTWGDRSDGRRLRSIDGMTLVGGYIMPNRNGASNSIQDTLEITAIERYIHKKRVEGCDNFGITHVFLAAYVRTVAKYPGFNRFFSGQRIYQRDDDIQFTMAMKKEMRTDGEETMIKLHLAPTDTSKEVYDKFNRSYEEVMNTPLNSSFDGVASALASIPGLLLKFLIWVLKCMDYFGKIPRFLLEVSPFHASVIFTSMGSLGIPPIVHHLYDFGNLPIFIAFGRKYRKTELDATGKPVSRRYLDYVVNCDERIVDGFYYATGLKYFHKLLRTPDVLDLPPEEVLHDIP